MASRRLTPVDPTVQLVVDDERVAAREGEPVAIALAGAGRSVLCRSVKYHRPRSAFCLSGRCDGCLMRVDGVPSVMTCRTPARDGMVIETQNVVGSARRDLLAATDWFFPDGMNHHEMFTWSEAVNKVMQKVARRVAGIGELPERVKGAAAAREVEVDVLVVGGGPAGLKAARSRAESGARTMLLEEDLEPGGAYRWWPAPIGGRPGVELAKALVTEAEAAGVQILTQACAVAAYDPWEDLLGAEGAAPPERAGPSIVVADTPDGLIRFRASEVTIATGRHEGGIARPGADRPGVLTFSAACRLLAAGVLPGERVVLVGEHTAAASLRAALERAGASVTGPITESALLEIRGGNEVESCVVDAEGRRRKHDCDVVVVAPPTSAAYELAAQLGVPVNWSGTGFELGLPPPDVRVVGWAAGGDTNG